MTIQVIEIPIVGEKMPSYQTPGASGADLYAAISTPVHLLPGMHVVIPTGVKMEIPQGYEGQVRARSGLASKGIMVANSPGTIDSDYRGEIKVLIFNAGNYMTTINPGDRIAQMVFAAVVRAKFVPVDPVIFSETERGVAGFGSTGEK